MLKLRSRKNRSHNSSSAFLSQQRVSILTDEVQSAAAGSAKNLQAFKNIESLVDDLDLQNKKLSSQNFDLKRELSGTKQHLEQANAQLKVSQVWFPEANLKIEQLEEEIPSLQDGIKNGKAMDEMKGFEQNSIASDDEDAK